MMLQGNQQFAHGFFWLLNGKNFISLKCLITARCRAKNQHPGPSRESMAASCQADARSAGLGIRSVIAIDVQHKPRFALCLRLVDGGHLPTKSFTRFSVPLGRLNALDAAPALSAFGLDLSHLFLGMMRPAVVTKDGVGHGVL
jgi:hypothetical protein